MIGQPLEQPSTPHNIGYYYHVAPVQVNLVGVDHAAGNGSDTDLAEDNNIEEAMENVEENPQEDLANGVAGMEIENNVALAEENGGHEVENEDNPEDPFIELLNIFLPPQLYFSMFEYIFEYIPFQDIAKLKQVNKKWKEIIEYSLERQLKQIQFKDEQFKNIINAWREKCRAEILRTLLTIYNNKNQIDENRVSYRRAVEHMAQLLINEWHALDEANRFKVLSIHHLQYIFIHEAISLFDEWQNEWNSLPDKIKNNWGMAVNLGEWLQMGRRNNLEHIVFPNGWLNVRKFPCFFRYVFTCPEIANAFLGIIQLRNNFLKNIHEYAPEDRELALVLAAHDGYIDIVRTLLGTLETNPQLIHSSKHGWTALGAAASNGHQDIVETLMNEPSIEVQNANAGSRGSLAADHVKGLTSAHTNGHQDLISVFLRHPRANGILNQMENDPYAALRFATTNNYIDAIESLLEQLGGGTDSGAFIQAARNGNYDVVQALLRMPLDRIDVNAKDIQQKTALMYAIENGHARIVSSLLKLGQIDLRARNMEGRDALMLAIVHEQENIAKELIKRRGILGIDFRAKDNTGKSAWMLAAQKGYRDLAKAIQYKMTISR